LDDRRFPVNRCSGLLVLPDMGRQTMAFGRLVISATERVHKGSDLWFGTKIVASREGVLTVRTWERSEGNIQTWRHVVRTLSD
jgi:hypothetical protein